VAGGSIGVSGTRTERANACHVAGDVERWAYRAYDGHVWRMACVSVGVHMGVWQAFGACGVGRVAGDPGASEYVGRWAGAW
jgi:hypothetical protein